MAGTGFPFAANPVYGGANPNPAYHGTFIPEIWSGKIIDRFYDSTVLAEICNTDYQGEFANQGDTIKIRTKPAVNVSDYTIGMNLTLQRPSSNIVEMVIDKGLYFATILEDVWEVQSDINLMSLFADDASERMKLKIDSTVLFGILHQCSADNRGLTAGRVSHSINLGVTGSPLLVVARDAQVGEVEVTDLLVRLGATLDEQNIPEPGRFCIMPGVIMTKVKQSELRNAALSGDSVSMLRNGKVGMVDRFQLFTSNLLPAGVLGGLAAGEYVVYAGHKHATSFAAQMTKMETLRAESAFGNILRGLQIYGFKVLDGIALAEAIVTI